MSGGRVCADPVALEGQRKAASVGRYGPSHGDLVRAAAAPPVSRQGVHAWLRHDRDEGPIWVSSSRAGGGGRFTVLSCRAQTRACSMRPTLAARMRAALAAKIPASLPQTGARRPRVTPAPSPVHEPLYLITPR